MDENLHADDSDSSVPHPANTYSKTWYDIFLRTTDPKQSEKEVAFITRQLPDHPHPTILDMCCGNGRHANRLATGGYVVTGIDIDDHSLDEARALNSGATYIQHDMREVDKLNHSFDGVICMWASFGYFDAETNVSILKYVYDSIHDNGVLILDIYNPQFFRIHQGRRQFTTGRKEIIETKVVTDNRLRVTLNYGHTSDIFDWQLFEHDDLLCIMQEIGFSFSLSCTRFDEHQAPDEHSPRIQYVFRK